MVSIVERFKKLKPHLSTLSFKSTAIQQAALRAGIVFIILVTLALGILASAYQMESDSRLTATKEKQADLVEKRRVSIVWDLRGATADFLFLFSSPRLKDFANGARGSRDELSREWLKFFNTRGTAYEELLLMDETGAQRIRINHLGENLSFVPRQELQDKNNQDDFDKAFKLERGVLFISPMELAVEHGKIVTPFKPLLRMAAPVFNMIGEKKGALILTYRASQLLNQIQPESMMLLNAEGFWMKGGKPENRWGFALGHGKAFDKFFPEEWKTIKDSEKGQFQTANGFFTFATVYPVRETGVAYTDVTQPYVSKQQAKGGHEKYVWKLVSYLPSLSEESDLLSLRTLFQKLTLGFGAIFLFLAIFVFWVFWKRQMTEENSKREQKRFQILNDAIPIPIYYKDIKGVYTGCNQAYEKFFGRTRDEIIGKTVFDFFSAKDAAEFKKRDEAFFSSSKNLQTYERILTAADGKPGDYIISKIKFHNPEGVLEGEIVVMFDVTERKTLERDLHEVKERAEKLNRNLLQSNQELVDKNQQVLASIEYASHIQNGILMDREEIIEHFAEAFILFKPKDVLSGDFYWFAQKEDLLMIAAIDCTGHGVPGALMTVLGNELLNQIVYEQGLIQPDLILYALDLKLRIALQKRNEQDEVRDGMEMAFCVIDAKNFNLQFVGAKNPLYWMHNDVIEEIKGSHFDIGGKESDKDKVFDLHTQKIEKGDVFYIFTDGFQDQLSEDGRKFMSKHLKEILLANRMSPLKEQEKILKKEFGKWHGRKPQTDDILVIGFKVF